MKKSNSLSFIDGFISRAMEKNPGKGSTLHPVDCMVTSIKNKAKEYDKWKKR